jgi:uncharacterized protein
VKFVIVILAILLLAWLLLGSSRRRAKEARRDDPSPHAASRTASEGMVTCAHCGVHLPGSLALQSRGVTYCSAAHRDAGPRDCA